MPAHSSVMAEDFELQALVSELAQHPHIELLSARVLQVALLAAKEKDQSFGAPRAPSERRPLPVSEKALEREQAQTRLFNVIDLLEQGPQNEEQSSALGALVALGVAHVEPDAREPSVIALVWLSANTSCDALTVLDPAMGGDAGELWHAVADVAAAPKTANSEFGNAEALVAAAALGSSRSITARSLALELSHAAKPALRALLARPLPADASMSLRGELCPTPRGPFLTALMAFTLVLFLAHVVRLFGRFLLAYRRPAELSLSPRGLELQSRTELLGR
ncbi:MAG TPA: hypothetical protein VGJ84_20955, partial [Polyangiaceae bacterium]